MAVASPAPPVSEPTAPGLSAILATNVREAIARFPAIGKLLDEYAIHCATCSLGTCRLQDIVDIHGLSPAQETTLLTRLAQVVLPGVTVQIPQLPRRAAARAAGPVRFSPPLRELVEEHTVIKRAIAMLPVLAASLSAGVNDVSRRQVQELLAFVRNFADRFHHAKEEDLLFPLFEDAGEIITSMRAEHEVGRDHVRAASAALAAADAVTVATHLQAYATLLMEHIRKEDEILYPWMDRALNDTQIGRLFAAFREVETRFGDGPAMERAVVTRLENEVGIQKQGERQ
ncbi:MAG: hemerythrin domain-containing protein [Kiritimatiellia bacterium]